MTITEILLIIVSGFTVIAAIGVMITSFILYKKTKYNQERISKIVEENSETIKEVAITIEQFPTNESVEFLNDSNAFLEQLSASINQVVTKSFQQELGDFFNQFKDLTAAHNQDLSDNFDEKADELLDRIINSLDFTLKNVIESIKEQKTDSPEKSYHFEIKEFIVELLKRVNSGTLRADDILIKCRNQFNIDIKLENYFSILKELDQERRIYIPSKYLGPDTIIMLTQ